MRWWSGAVGYEVYLRSFADSDGDGVGDLGGLLDRLDHIAELGADIVWVTPFYPSPMRDHGYDVADYRGVDPLFGDLGQVDACIAKAHALGMRVLIDLVPNHSSGDHEWFVAARSSRDNPHRDYYVWRDPAPDGGPPNNWMSVFGGLAWTLDETTGQYWLHLFLPEQPDLNWTNPAVRDAFDDILRFWLQRGVDGFRIDVAHALMKAPGLPDNPPAAVADDAEMGTVASTWETLEHVYDQNQPEVLDIYRRWRRIADEYDAVLLGEVYLLDVESLASYLDADDGLHLAFWFKPMHVKGGGALAAALQEGLSLRTGGVAWVQGSHDRYRAATRYGGGEVGRCRQLAMATLHMGLPGVAFIYQGEELGLEDGRLTLAESQDPVALHEQDPARGRDGCRTPIPWEPGPGMGFTTATKPWLPFGGRTDSDTVAVQQRDPDSMLNRYRELVRVRREMIAPLGDAPVQIVRSASHDGVIAYVRAGTLVAANLGDQERTIANAAAGWEVAFSVGGADLSADGDIVLPAASALIARN